ncbi:MAG: helix-turn-helix domain-containing protein, partial [Desulfovibrio sp.]|nr:helix-turn-helix domain-containing protein [Desulfovibrio sp.]
HLSIRRPRHICKRPCYYKQLRLHEARRLILEEHEQARLAAARVGYGSAQQFNRDYKRLFGQPPLKSRKYRE